MAIGNPLYSKCPSCSSESSLRSSRPRNKIEGIIKTFTWFRLFRCKKCGWRGYKSTLTISSKEIKKLLIYFLMMIAAAFIVYQILKRIA
jgi:hypothetical protein